MEKCVLWYFKLRDKEENQIYDDYPSVIGKPQPRIIHLTLVKTDLLSIRYPPKVCSRHNFNFERLWGSIFSRKASLSKQRDWDVIQIPRDW